MLKSILVVLLGIFMFGILWVDPVKAGEAVVTFFQSVIDFMVYVAKNIQLPKRGSESAALIVPFLMSRKVREQLRLDLASTNQEEN